MRGILITALVGAVCGALGAFIAEWVVKLVSELSAMLAGSIVAVLYKTVIGFFVGLAGIAAKKFSSVNYRQPLAGALSAAAVAIILPVRSTIGGWFVMSFCMVIFACSISLAGKLRVKNVIGGIVGGVITGIVSSIILWKLGGVATWAIVGFIIWLSIGMAKMIPLPERLDGCLESAVKQLKERIGKWNR